MEASGVRRNVRSMTECGVGKTDSQSALRGGTVIETVQRSHEAAIRATSTLSVVVAGLDDFQAVNEQLGPIGGDAVLAAFTDLVNRTVGKAMRLGGDQLIAVLPGMDAPDSGALAEGLREKIAASMITAVGKVTASFGVAAYPESTESAQELVYGSQAAMYWAKAKGGNRVDYWGEMVGARARDPMTALAIAVERKIRAGPGQLARSAWYARQMATEMGIGPEDHDLIEKGALLHDVGKLAVPEEILQKPGSLSEEEMAVIKAHPAVGAEIVSRTPELAAIAPIIAHHHEHVDGSGYPDGLVGDAIPLISRIVLVSDAVEAMTTERSYKSVISLQEALQELHRCSGRQFDKRVVDAFATIVNRRGLQALHWSQIRRQMNHI